MRAARIQYKQQLAELVTILGKPIPEQNRIKPMIDKISHRYNIYVVQQTNMP